MVDETSPVYTLREAAAKLGISMRTVRKHVLEGRLPASKQPGKFGETYYVEGSALDAFRDRPKPPAGGGGQGSGQAGPQALALAGVQAMAATIEARARADADALERAWGRIADLERDNAALRSRLDAGEAPTGDGDAPRDAEGRNRPLTWRERLSGRLRAS